MLLKLHFLFHPSIFIIIYEGSVSWVICMDKVFFLSSKEMSLHIFTVFLTIKLGKGNEKMDALVMVLS